MTIPIVVGVVAFTAAACFAAWGWRTHRAPYIPDGPLTEDDHRPAVVVESTRVIEAAP